MTLKIPQNSASLCSKDDLLRLRHKKIENNIMEMTHHKSSAVPPVQAKLAD
jgi:hypothetical protein